MRWSCALLKLFHRVRVLHRAQANLELKSMSLFSRRTVLAVFAGLVVSVASFAQALYQEGVQYTRLKQPMPVTSGAQVEVLEVFSYACPHCAHLEPTMATWRATMPRTVKFALLPAIFHDTWAAYARAYYAAEQLKLVEKTHGALFKAIYEQNKQFASVDEMAAWYATFGVTAKQFKDAFTAPGMEAKLKRSVDLTPRYEVGGTPTLIIDGKYSFDVVTAGGLERIPGLLNFLIQKAASERVAQKKG
jgi:protein dithiol oxidoreductase (disulfide-forming)